MTWLILLQPLYGIEYCAQAKDCFIEFARTRMNFGMFYSYRIICSSYASVYSKYLIIHYINIYQYIIINHGIHFCN